MVSCMLRLMVTMTMLGMAVSGPRERVMVKHKVKDGETGERIEVMDTNDKEEAVNMNIVETDGVTEKGAFRQGVQSISKLFDGTASKGSEIWRYVSLYD